MNLAQSDPYYIPQAARDGRLFLRRSIGPLSGGTCVRFVSAEADYASVVVEAEVTQTPRLRVNDFGEPQTPKPVTIQLDVTPDDLVIRRHHDGGTPTREEGADAE